MKKILLILVALISVSSMALAQKSRSSKSSSDNPREDRTIAITTEAGWKTTSGAGINVSYYVIPKLAIDGGVGIGLQGLKFGTRARYLFLDQEFSPVLGIGFNMSPMSFGLDTPELIRIDADLDPATPPEEVLVDIELNRSYYGHIFTGLDWVSQGGFVVALNLGYRISLNKTIDTDVVINGETFDIVDSAIDSGINTLVGVYGSGFSASLHLGYAF